MATRLEILQEAERRGRSLSKRNQDILTEAKRRGKISPTSQVGQLQQPQQALQQPQQALQQPQQSAIGEAISNIPKSGVQVLKDMFQAVSSPIETIKGVRDIAVGGTAKLLPSGVQPLQIQQKAEKKFDVFINQMTERFGGLEELENTFRKDPVGLLIDAFTVFGGVGALAGKAGTVAKLPKLAKAGKLISKTAKVLDPLEAFGQLGKRLIPTGKGIVKSVLSLPKKLGLQRIDDLAEAFLKKGLNVNKKALKSLDVDLSKVKKSINSIVDAKTSQGLLIKTDDIVSALDNLIANSTKQGFELPDLKIIERMRDNFVKQNGAFLTSRQVQDLKIGFNKGFTPNLESRFGQVRAKVRDKLRDSARLELEKLHPELRGLNAKQGVMIELNRAITDTIIKFEKSPVIPGKGLIAGGVATAIGATTDIATGLKFGASAFLAGKILADPKVQIGVAKALNKANLTLAKAGKLTKVILPAFQAGRAERISRPLTLEQRQSALSQLRPIPAPQGVPFISTLQKPQNSILARELRRNR